MATIEIVKSAKNKFIKIFERYSMKSMGVEEAISLEVKCVYISELALKKLL